MKEINSGALTSQETDGKHIGLLGGSFNPAHGGHIDLSLLAIEKLFLNTVWWLVSPQNPLKSKKDMATLSKRLLTARIVAGHPRIHVTDIETKLCTLYTVDTLLALRDHFPKANFIWLMGADNLMDMHRWQRWAQIFHTVPIAVFARPNYSLPAEDAEASRQFAPYRIPASEAHNLAVRRPPAWVFFDQPLNPISATEIRNYDKNLDQ